MSSPATTTRPSVGDRMPPAIEQRVVLPDPDGPTRATISSCSIVSGRVIQRDDFFVAGGIHLAHRLQLQCWHTIRAHEDLPIADAGSTRSRRRSENALPTTAASTNAMLLMITRLGSNR